MDKDIEPSPEILAAHPELNKIKLSVPVLDDKFYLSSQFQGGFNVVMAEKIPSTPGISTLISNLFEQARQAIEEKARILGSLPGAPISDVQQVGSGFMRHYQGCDIFYNVNLHIINPINPINGLDVSGDIRIKMQKSFAQRVTKK